MARREHSDQELVLKLGRRGFSKALIGEVIAELKAEGWQDQRRFVESFIRACTGRGIGPLRIRFELKAKGAPTDLIEEVLSELAIDWRQAAQAVYRRKYKSLIPLTEKERARRYRFLAQRGFAAEHIQTLLEEP